MDGKVLGCPWMCEIIITPLWTICVISLLIGPLPMYIHAETCRSINDKANADHPPEDGMMVNYADFNVGFQPTVWKQICKATGKPIFQPLEEAIELLKPDTNYVQQSNRLTYSEGDMWFYLKAEERQYCQRVLEVGGMATSVRI